MKQGQVPLAELIDLKTSHDIRHLCRCQHCRELGLDRDMVQLSDREFFHGRCFVAVFGLPELLTLPHAETGKLRLGDLGVELMKAVIKARSV